MNFTAKVCDGEHHGRNPVGNYMCMLSNAAVDFSFLVYFILINGYQVPINAVILYYDMDVRIKLRFCGLFHLTVLQCL